MSIASQNSRMWLNKKLMTTHLHSTCPTYVTLAILIIKHSFTLSPCHKSFPSHSAGFPKDCLYGLRLKHSNRFLCAKQFLLSILFPSIFRHRSTWKTMLATCQLRKRCAFTFTEKFCPQNDNTTALHKLNHHHFTYQPQVFHVAKTSRSFQPKLSPGTGN